jgi:uncharacterized protein YjiS (DUF1127 family)
MRRVVPADLYMHAMPASRRDRRPVVENIVRAWSWVRECDAQVTQRRALGELDDRLLHDVGLTRAAAAGEICKRFWQK